MTVKTEIFHGRIKERYSLTKPGSTKSTYHVVLDTDKTNIPYQVGDSIAIYPQNDPHLVETILQCLDLDPDTPVMDKKREFELPFGIFLLEKANLARPTSNLFNTLSQNGKGPTFEDKAALRLYLHERDVSQLLKAFKNFHLSAQEFCDHLSPMLPRYYSVASSKLAHPHEVHLTVALTSHMLQGETRFGVASHYLCHLADKQVSIPFFVAPAKNFALPQDPNTPIIMIGPGTGVAPYRAFIQERVAMNAPGGNWLFFGERNQKTDFFYEEEWQSYVDEGYLTLDATFSRDGNPLKYVGDALLEKQDDVWQELQKGAILYVCGDAHQMARSVDEVLQKIVASKANLSSDDAKAHLRHLMKEGRYLRDVY